MQRNFSEVDLYLRHSKLLKLQVESRKIINLFKYIFDMYYSLFPSLKSDFGYLAKFRKGELFFETFSITHIFYILKHMT